MIDDLNFGLKIVDYRFNKMLVVIEKINMEAPYYPIQVI